MSEEEDKSETDEQKQDAGEQEQPDEQKQEPFDRERAMATIKKLREGEKTSSKQLKELEARVKQFEQADQKRKEAEMSDLQKAQATLQAEQERAGKLESELLDLRLRQSFYDAAAGARLEFVSPKAREAAFVLALAGLEVGDDGTVNADEVVKALQKEHGYLFGAGQKTPNIDGDKRGKGKESHDSERIRAKYGIQ